MPLDDMEQKDLQSKGMQLKDLLEEQSVASISKKTNLTVGIVEKLLSKDFKSLKKPQLLGALSIIEREYNVDLSALREECKDYFAENAPSDQGLTVLKPIRQERSYFPKILATVLLGLIAYGAWYLFSEYYHKKITPMDPPSVKSLNSTILQDEDTSFIDVKTAAVKERSAAESPAVQSIGAEAAEEKQPEISQNAMHAVEDRQAETDQSAMQEEEAAVVGSEKQGETMLTDEKIVSTEANSSEEDLTSLASRETITLLPQGVMWFNLFHLDSKKRSYFKRKNKFDIDVKENEWLFATENAKFTFIDNGVITEFGGEGEFFFRLDSTGVHELSVNEYRTEEQ
ncbi:MAG: hypothetical protein U9Q90_06740 [Campylobacterota bacterium]|nr:hypothetical protein [Campylobacterota bacterium]